MNDSIHPTTRICRCDDKHKNYLIDEVSPKIAEMTPGDKCKAKDLFDKDFWTSLSHAQKIEIGECIVCLVAQGLLPLENLGASQKSANHIIYRKL